MVCCAVRVPGIKHPGQTMPHLCSQVPFVGFGQREIKRVLCHCLKQPRRLRLHVGIVACLVFDVLMHIIIIIIWVGAKILGFDLGPGPADGFLTSLADNLIVILGITVQEPSCLADKSTQCLRNHCNNPSQAVGLTPRWFPPSLYIPEYTVMGPT